MLTTAQSRRSTRPGVMAALAYVAAIGMTAIDNQIVNVALPSIGRSFAVSLASLQWVVIGYAVALAVVMPASGWFGDRIGTKRAFLFALAGFTLSSALCGAAPGLIELVGARVLQGLCGGMLIPAGTALLYRAFPTERRARIARLVVVPVILGPAIAPMLGGILITLSWRYVFFVNIPVGLVLGIVLNRNLDEHRAAVHDPLDLPGVLGSAMGMTALLYAISEGATLGWGSAAVIGAGVVGAVALTWFTRRQLLARYPVLDLRLLTDRLFRGGVVVIGLATASFLGILYLVPVYLQEVHHQTPLGSGATTFTEAVGVAVASQTLARMYPRLGPRRMATLGSFGIAAVLVWMMFGSAQTSLWLIRLQMFLMGGMNSAIFLSVQASVFTNVSHGRTAHASAIFVTQRQSSIAIGVAILTSVVNMVAGTALHRFHAGFLAAASLAAFSAVASFTLIRTEDARESMRRPEEAIVESN